MDDNAQIPPVPGQFRPEGFKISQDDTTVQATSVSDTQTQPVVVPPPAPLPPVAKPTADGQLHRQMEKPEKQQISIGGNPERGAIVVEVNEDDDEDEKQAAKQEAPIVQVSHPEVIIPEEVKEVGVEAGQDADRTKLPEEKEHIDVAAPEEQKPEEAAQITANEANLPMSYEDAVATKKQSKVNDAIKWMAALIAYHWEKFRVQNPAPVPEEPVEEKK